jgi:hypothetical protein
MKIYFLSSQPCALSVNGAYFGITDRFSRHADISLKDELFITFTPENALPISFFLREDILHNPPVGVQVYRAQDFLALYAFDFHLPDQTLRLHAQLRTPNALCSVFTQGGTQCAIQTQEKAFISTLPPSFTQCDILSQGEFLLIKSPEMLAIYHENGTQLFLESVIEYSLQENELKVTLPLRSHLSQTMECEYTLTPTQAVRTRFALRAPQTPNAQESLLAYAFFESVLLGLDYTPLLCDELLKQKENLLAFIKGYTFVTLTQKENECALVYPKGERLFELRLYRVEIENGKIIDVKC